MSGLGVDFGGVIVKLVDRKQVSDTQLSGTEGTEIAQEGVFEAMAKIVSHFEGRVWIVSKAGPRMQAKTLAWLDAVDFYSRTGLDKSHVEFCRERQDKATICQKIEITHFIDDRVHIMQILRNVVPNIYFYGEETAKGFCPPWATFVSDWASLPSVLSQQ